MSIIDKVAKTANNLRRREQHRFDSHSFLDSRLADIYWYAHDAVLMLLMGLALLPLLLKPSPNGGTNRQVIEGYPESFASEYEQISGEEF